MSDTRNYGVSAAKGKYVSFLDSDDWIVENLYADIVAEMEADKIDMLKFGFVETDGVAGKKKFIWEAGSNRRKRSFIQQIF